MEAWLHSLPRLWLRLSRRSYRLTLSGGGGVPSAQKHWFSDLPALGLTYLECVELSQLFLLLPMSR